MNELGAAGQPGRGSFFTPDSPEIAEKAEHIEKANHAEQKEMFERLNEENRRRHEELDK